MNVFIISFFCVFILTASSFESINSSSLTGKLVGGQRVSPKEGNYLVYITHKDVHKFSGFLISERYVFTAAHNLQEFWTQYIIPWFEDYSVVVGCFNESITGKKHSLEQVQAYKYYEHKNPKPNTDIALIKLKEPVKRSEFVDWISLVANKDFNMCEKSFGWGWDIYKEEGSSVQLSVRKKIEVKVIMKFFCKATINSNIFCTKAVNSAESLSQEDAGAPLIQGMEARGIYSTNFQTVCLVYTAFTNSMIARIKKMQTQPDDIEHFLKFSAHRAPRRLARWEQNHRSSRKKQRA